MITQFYKGALNVVKVEITGKEVIFYDSNLCKNGVNALQVLARDREKLGKWKTRIKNLTEKEIAQELKKDFMKDLGLHLSSEVIK